MEINATNIQALANTWRALMKPATGLPTEHEAWFYDVPVDGPLTAFTFLERITRVTKWTGPRDLGSFKRHPLSLRVTPYSDAIEVSARDLQYDRLAQYGAELARMANDKVLFKRDLRNAMLLNGEGSGDEYLAYDQVPFFSKNHPIEKQFVSAGKQVNYYTSTALTVANVKAMIAAQRVLKNGSGEDLGVNPNLLWFTPDQASAADDVLNQQYEGPTYSNMKTNTLKGALTPLMLPSGSGKWGTAMITPGADQPFAFGHGIQTDPRFLVQPGDEKLVGMWGFDFDFGVLPLWWQYVARADV